MADNTPQSPDSLQLRGSPLTSARLSKKAALAAIVVLAVILGVVIVNVSQDSASQTTTADEEAAQRPLQPALNAAQTLTRDVPDVAPPLPPKQTSLSEHRSAPALPSASSAPATRTRTSEDDARLADTVVTKFSVDDSFGMKTVAATNETSGAEPVLQDAGNSARNSRSRRNADLASFLEDDFGDEPDLNQQAQKLAFQRQRHGSGYLDARLKAPISPYELKTGTVIPGILVSEMNSDLPGEIIAQVSQNVYDSATGNYLLIPQGTKLFGVYDSKVAFGQDRLLVSWQRLIYPDASTLDLGGMNGHDEEGKGGFGDRVNNHYVRLFGMALLTSTLSAAYQLSQDPESQNQFRSIPSDQQVAAAAVGQQMAELGIEIARRNLRVQPTIEVRKGYRLNVMVNKDVVFPGSYTP